MKFLSPKAALYLYKASIMLCIKYCCHVWAGAPHCYLDMLNKLQKWVCRTVGPTFAASLEPLGHCRNLANLSRFYSCYFGRSSTELVNWFHFFVLVRGTQFVLIECMIFLVTFPRFYKDVYVSSMPSYYLYNLVLNIHIFRPSTQVFSLSFFWKSFQQNPHHRKGDSATLTCNININCTADSISFT